MVSHVDLLQTLHDELVTVVSDNTSVTTPEDHVGVLNRTTDATFPFFGFEWQINPVNRGTNDNVRTIAVNEDNQGNVQSVTRLREYEALIDIGVITDGDDPRQRDEYMNEVQDHFTQFVVLPSSFQEDVSDFTDNGAIPYSPADGHNTAARLTYAIEYGATTESELPTAETVNLDVDATDQTLGDTDAYPEKY